MGRAVDPRISENSTRLGSRLTANAANSRAHNHSRRYERGALSSNEGVGWKQGMISKKNALSWISLPPALYIPSRSPGLRNTYCIPPRSDQLAKLDAERFSLIPVEILVLAHQPPPARPRRGRSFSISPNLRTVSEEWNSPDADVILVSKESVAARSSLLRLLDR